MQKLPYLLRNRNGNFYIRITAAINNQRKEFRFSLHTQFFCVAKIRYFISMPLIQALRVELGMQSNIDNLSVRLAEVKSAIQALQSVYREEKPAWQIAMKHWKADYEVERIECDLARVQQHAATLENERATSAQVIQHLMHSQSTITAPVDNKSLYLALCEYLAEKAPEWRSRTKCQNEAYCYRFAEIVGLDTPTQSLNGEVISKYRDVIAKLPTNAPKHRIEQKECNAKALVAYWHKLACKKHKHTLTYEGQNSHFAAVRGFLSWLEARYLTAKNYSSYITLSPKVLAANKVCKAPFSRECLEHLFESYIYGDEQRTRERPKNYQFWLPLIALTTGMRVAEIAGIEKQDIRQVNDIWVFDINEQWTCEKHPKQGLDKRKKNKPSLRLVPIPQVVLDAGLLEFVAQLDDDDFLLNDLTRMKNKPLGDKASEWFNARFLGYVGIEKTDTDGNKVTLHSMRHTFITRINNTKLNDTYLPPYMLHYVSGHEQDSVRNKVYSHEFDLREIKLYMDAVEYGVDFASISYSRFANRKRCKK